MEGRIIAGIGTIADGILRTVEGVQSGVNEALFEPVVRLGVTGLARSGKTVFITSLVANLLDRGRMKGLVAEAEGRILQTYLEPQPDHGVPRFDFEGHLDTLTGADPDWPESTRSISQLRLSIRLRGGGLLSGLTGPRTVHLDIVDYPGEWLLDLALLDLSFEEWSAKAFEMAAKPGHAHHAAAWLAATDGVDPGDDVGEPAAQALARAFTEYLARCREAGLSGLTPGRFLMPGDLEGSPALTFAPLAKPERARGSSLWRQFEKRYESYKRIVVRPFFRDHFARIDRQVVLVDALSAIHAGPAAVEDLRAALVDVLSAFRPGPNTWLSSILGKRVERILFAATKADHLHHAQHSRLVALMKAMVREASDRAAFRGAAVEAAAIASLRATVEQTITHDGRPLDVVRGRLLDTGKMAALHPGDLPEDPGRILSPARRGEEAWLDGDYSIMRFAPAGDPLSPGDGPPHIRLDRAIEFLIGDRLR
ncbi:MAG: YcjX family protein [Rubricella sp.]